MKAHYHPLLGSFEGARRLHIHRTELVSDGLESSYVHSHKAEEAMYILGGQAEFVIDGQRSTAGPGEVVFFPSGSVHGITRVVEGPIQYVTIRTVEEEDEPCCCEGTGHG